MTSHSAHTGRDRLRGRTPVRPSWQPSERRPTPYRRISQDHSIPDPPLAPALDRSLSILAPQQAPPSPRRPKARRRCGQNLPPVPGTSRSPHFPQCNTILPQHTSSRIIPKYTSSVIISKKRTMRGDPHPLSGWTSRLCPASTGCQSNWRAAPATNSWPPARHVYAGLLLLRLRIAQKLGYPGTGLCTAEMHPSATTKQAAANHPLVLATPGTNRSSRPDPALISAILSANIPPREGPARWVSACSGGPPESMTRTPSRTRRARRGRDQGPALRRSASLLALLMISDAF